VSLILAWVLFPLVLAAVGAGWGAVVEWATGSPVSGVLLIPLGLSAVIIATSLLTLWTNGSITAPAAMPIVVLIALVGLVVRRPFRRVTLWPLLAAIGVLLAYGAPVILSGSATFLGYIRLDDTASFLDIIDHAMTHLQLPVSQASTYGLEFAIGVGPTYPLGAFMLVAVGHELTGIDAAWILQPYMACCGVGVALGIYALLEPLLASPRLRALVAFFAAQAALLYGYSLWGGQKELTAAFLLVLGTALLVRVMLERPASPRGLLPVAVAAGALILTLGIGAAGFIVPALIVLAIVWVRRAWPRELKAVARDLGVLGATTAFFALPVWITVSQFLGERSHGLFSSGTVTAEEKLGNLIHPLSVWQLAGIWPVGDFRLTAPTLPSALLIGVALIAAVAALWMTVRRRQYSLIAYVAVGAVGAAIYYLIGSTPWVVGKSLAIASPALLTAALAGGAMLWNLRSRHRLVAVVGVLVMVVIGGGVIWSNFLGYHDALLAPRARLAELQHIGKLVAGKGPTFINEYEIYADRHFLGAGAPTEPAEYRSATLALNDNAILTKAAYADLDSFPVSTLKEYRSIVTTRAPIESRPPSIYKLVWQGRYYQLWQRPAQPSTRILEQVPFGDSSKLPYCGSASNAATLEPCSIAPVAVPPCTQIEGLARVALNRHAELVAYQRPEPIVVGGDQMRWPAGWYHEPEAHSLTATVPGTGVSHIAVASSQRYELWLGGSFSRGFDVSVDGRHIGQVKDQLGNIGYYAPVADLFLKSGVHTFELTYPHSGLTPGSGDNEFTTLTAIALEPLERPSSELLTVSPRQAKSLCGRPLDWIEIVAPRA
jgi:hypothetical protein